MSDTGSANQSSGLRAHAFLVFILGLVAVNAVMLLWVADFGRGVYLNLLVAIGLLVHLTARRYVTKGWPGVAMKVLAYAWVGFFVVYVVWFHR